MFTSTHRLQSYYIQRLFTYKCLQQTRTDINLILVDIRY